MAQRQLRIQLAVQEYGKRFSTEEKEKMKSAWSDRCEPSGKENEGVYLLGLQDIPWSKVRKVENGEASLFSK